uniref:MTH1187 family thiamine-binding protein n=1 Tax=Desulfobacca acetoxidans TaxID=60893 RepID=A0A7C3Z0U9_9BACT
MALMEISVVPLGLGNPSVGDHIAALVDYLRKNNIPYRLTDMGTVIEGSPAKLLEWARLLHELPFEKGVQRVITHITLDDRRDKRVALGDKISSVEARLT